MTDEKVSATVVGVGGMDRLSPSGSCEECTRNFAQDARALSSRVSNTVSGCFDNLLQLVQHDDKSLSYLVDRDLGLAADKARAD